MVRDEGWEAVTAPISREFVHMDGLVVPLGAQAACCLPGCYGGLAGRSPESERGFEFVDVGYREAKDLGVNLVALGNDKVLSMKGSVKLNEKMRALGL